MPKNTPAGSSLPGFSAALGRRIRDIRVQHGLTQDQLALKARELRLDWTRSSVASLETGGRELTASEFVLLPLVLTRATSTNILMPDIVGEMPANFLIGEVKGGTPALVAALLWTADDLTLFEPPEPAAL